MGNMVEFKTSFLSPSPALFHQSVPEVLAGLDLGRSRAGCGINQHGGSGSEEGPGRWLYVLQASIQLLWYSAHTRRREMHGEKKQHKHGNSKKQAKKKQRGGVAKGEWDCNQKPSQFVCLVCHGTPKTYCCHFVLLVFNPLSLLLLFWLLLITTENVKSQCWVPFW